MAPTPDRIGRVRAGLRPLTTPGQLRLGLIVLVTGTAVFGVVAVRSATSRLDAARTVDAVASPQLIASQDVYVKLVDADATASAAFLEAGRGTPSLQQRYRDDLTNASQQLPLMARRSGSTSARAAVAVITDQLPVYTGLVEAAHANSLQGFPVGAAYLHEASQLMRNTILPAATTSYVDATSQLATADRAGSAPSEVVAVIVLGLLLVTLLVLMSVYLAVRTRRILNVGLGVATILTVTIVVVSTVAFVHEQDSLQRAQRRGADPLQVLSAARIMTLRTFSDENLDLIERGAVSDYMPDFNRVAAALQPSRQAGLISSSYVTPDIKATFAKYLSLHESVRRNDARGNYNEAVAVATSTEARAVADLDASLHQQIVSARSRLDTTAHEARSALALVAVLAAIMAIAGAVSIALGLRPRIREYT
jgi:hypothetical protein